MIYYRLFKNNVKGIITLKNKGKNKKKHLSMLFWKIIYKNFSFSLNYARIL